MHKSAASLGRRDVLRRQADAPGDKLTTCIAAPVPQNLRLTQPALTWYLALPCSGRQVGFIGFIEFVEFIEFIELIEAGDWRQGGFVEFIEFIEFIEFVETGDS